MGLIERSCVAYANRIVWPVTTGVVLYLTAILVLSILGLFSFLDECQGTLLPTSYAGRGSDCADLLFLGQIRPGSSSR